MVIFALTRYNICNGGNMEKINTLIHKEGKYYVFASCESIESPICAIREFEDIKLAVRYATNMIDNMREIGFSHMHCVNVSTRIIRKITTNFIDLEASVILYKFDFNEHEETLKEFEELLEKGA